MISNLVSSKDKSASLAGHLLVATHAVDDSCFERSVIYMCAHNEEGAMGVIINAPVAEVDIEDIFDQLKISHDDHARHLPIHFGGPVEAHRGFVLHSAEEAASDSIVCQDGIAVTANIAILQDLAAGKGPAQSMLVLGYAGWSPGQLESEIEQGSWLIVPANKTLVFDTQNETKHATALSALGIDMGHLSSTVGHA